MQVLIRHVVVTSSVITALLAGGIACDKKDEDTPDDDTDGTLVITQDQPANDDPDIGATDLDDDDDDDDAGSDDDGPFDVTVQVDANTSVSPSTTQSAAKNATLTFAVTASAGYTAAPEVGGSCPAGTWSGGNYTTGAITDDCTISFASYVNWTGMKLLGAAGVETRGDRVAVDGDGNVYMVGTANDGLAGQAQMGATDGFVVKYDRSGTLVWLRHLGLAGFQTYFKHVAVNTAGEIYAVGMTDGGLNGNTLNGGQDAVIAKYSSSGNLTWVRQLGSAGGVTDGSGIAVDGVGNVFIAGSTTVGVGGQSQNGNWDYFVAKYSAAGALTWLSQNGGGGFNSFAGSVAVDTDGLIYLAGTLMGGLNGNSQNGTYDAMAAKYDADGALVWLKQLGDGGGVTTAHEVRVDASGSVYIGGNTSVGLNGNPQIGTEDSFVAKFSSTGVLSWTKQIGVPGVPTASRGLSMDSAGHPIVLGITGGNLEGNVKTGTYDGFVAKFGSDGSVTWTQLFGAATGESWALGAGLDADDNIYVAGATERDIDGQTLVGTRDSVLVKFDAAGTQQ